jgi:hypothetical protein
METRKKGIATITPNTGKTVNPLIANTIAKASSTIAILVLDTLSKRHRFVFIISPPVYSGKGFVVSFQREWKRSFLFLSFTVMPGMLMSREPIAERSITVDSSKGLKRQTAGKARCTAL